MTPLRDLWPLAACAAAAEDVDMIAVVTDPPGASCVAEKAGAEIGEIDKTPGSFRVTAGPEPVRITCSRYGYQDATAINRPASSEGGDSMMPSFGEPRYAYAPNVKIELSPNAAPVSDAEKQQEIRVPRTGPADGAPTALGSR